MNFTWLKYLGRFCGHDLPYQYCLCWVDVIFSVIESEWYLRSVSVGDSPSEKYISLGSGHPSRVVLRKCTTRLPDAPLNGMGPSYLVRRDPLNNVTLFQFNHPTTLLRPPNTISLPWSGLSWSCLPRRRQLKGTSTPINSRPRLRMIWNVGIVDRLVRISSIECNLTDWSQTRGDFTLERTFRQLLLFSDTVTVSVINESLRNSLPT